MNGSLTTLSPPVIGDWGLSNVFSFLNIVKQFLILTCLVLCLRQPALHQYISLYAIMSLTYSLSLYKIKENVKLVYLHDQTGYRMGYCSSRLPGQS